MAICYTAIKPSGEITLGNYFGTIHHWRSLSQTYQCYFCIADLHAVTVYQDPAVLKERCLRFMAFYLANGFDPDTTTIYLQSQLPEHAELQWLFNCHVHMGELSRMTQYKDKIQGLKEQAIPAGLFNYPVLMAADIALFKSNVVPVGNDQKQHLELAREVISRVCRQYDMQWPIPEPLISEQFGKLMGLQQPTKKMSKSDAGENNIILFTDSPKLIQKKIMKSVTDSDSTIGYDPIGRPGVSNLVNLYALLSDKTQTDVCDEFVGKGYGDFKRSLADLVISVMEPLQEKMNQYLEDPEHLIAVFNQGKNKAKIVAEKNLKEIKDKMGLIS
mgnify:CR=1 FL=1|tara:strand:+ start:9298 stop:10287 length:990 start_codon:yes stop_codon:yes gene_type:complete